MFSIYNETKNQWTIEKINDSGNVVRFMKRKDAPESRFNNKRKKITRQVISILAYHSIFEDYDQVVEIVKGEVNNDKGVVCPIPTRNTNITFNRKAFRPFVSESAENVKDILLASVRLRGRKIVSMDNHNTFLLESFVYSGEFSFIVSFNNPSSKFTFTLLEEETRELTTYEFSSSEEGIVLNITGGEKLPDDESYDFIAVKRFRPARVTHLVLTLPGDRAKLDELIDPSKHTIVEVTPETVREVVEDVKSQFFSAVTLFVNSSSYKYDDAIEAFEDVYGQEVNFLHEFKLVYGLFSDRRILKVKY